MGRNHFFLLALFLLLPGILCNDYSNTWYVLLSSSKFYFNYRHLTNVLAVYRYLRRAGIADDHILLMLPDNYACNARNVFPGKIYRNTEHLESIFEGAGCASDLEVDVSGEALNVGRIFSVLRGRHTPGETPS